MAKIVIQSPDGNLRADVYPEYGGMVGRVEYKGREIIPLNEQQLMTSNVLAGGSPVMFPFPSKTKDDTWTYNGTTYTMPFHGIVKFGIFAVEECADDHVTLSIVNTPEQMKQCYPFDFKLCVTYTAKNDALDFDATIENRSSEDMPHYFGWHQYFTMSDRAKTHMIVPMKRYTNYMDMSEGVCDGSYEATRDDDSVFYDKTGNETVIINEGDGYRMTMQMDDVFQAVVINTVTGGKITCEPWIALPDSINTGKYLHWLAAGETESNHVSCLLEAI